MSETLVQQARDFIYEKIARGELKAGARLFSRRIAKEIGISSIPVREAISRLAGEGLVDQQPKIGAFVAQPNRQELAELYELREALECYAVGKAARSIDEEDLREMQRHNETLCAILEQAEATDTDVLDEQTGSNFIAADVAFHMVIVRASGNRRVIKAVSDLRVMSSIFGHQRQSRTRSGMRSTTAEHAKIMQALRDRNVPLAQRAMAKHIRRGCEAALRAFDRSRARGSSTDVGSLIERIHKLEA